MKPIKVFQIGCGKMSKYIMQYVLDLNWQIIGAVDINDEIIGQDINEIIGGKKTGVIINHTSKLNELLQELKPEIAVIATASYLKDIAETIRTCILNHVNVITTSEESFYAQSSNPHLFKELDILAKTNGVTITGSGYQDVFWGSLITIIASSTHNITKIKGSSSYNVEDYGIALAKAHGVGLTPIEFEEKIAAADNISDEERTKLINEGKFNASYMWNTAYWLAAKLGLTPIKATQKCLPTYHQEEIHSKTLNMNIAPSLATGMSAITTLETKEGIVIEAECIGKVYSQEDYDKNEWTIYGEPDTTITINRPDTVKLTCANIVNRIPDVIKANSGFRTTNELGEGTYKLTE